MSEHRTEDLLRAALERIKRIGPLGVDTYPECYRRMHAIAEEALSADPSADETSERLDPEKRYPIPVKEIVWRLEGESGNTDTDPRWLAANLLRQMENWENRTLMCRIDQRPSMVQFTEKAGEEP